MPIKQKYVPTDSYGIAYQNAPASVLEVTAESVRTNGFAVFNPQYSDFFINEIAQAFDNLNREYSEQFGIDFLIKANEHNTIRAPILSRFSEFWRLALDADLLALIQLLVHGKFLLNQQNGVINPPRSAYNQGSWHRDFPYQHFTSSRPLGINALFCIDEFTTENGATFVLPGSHLREAFPSKAYIESNAKQITAPRGSFIVMDCMCFHSGGWNATDNPRRAVNHVYTIPYFQQQISLNGFCHRDEISTDHLEVLGLTRKQPQSIDEYLSSRPT